MYIFKSILSCAEKLFVMKNFLWLVMKLRHEWRLESLRLSKMSFTAKIEKFWQVFPNQSNSISSLPFEISLSALMINFKVLVDAKKANCINSFLSFNFFFLFVFKMLNHLILWHISGWPPVPFARPAQVWVDPRPWPGGPAADRPWPGSLTAAGQNLAAVLSRVGSPSSGTEEGFYRSFSLRICLCTLKVSKLL